MEKLIAKARWVDLRANKVFSNLRKKLDKDKPLVMRSEKAFRIVQAERVVSGGRDKEM